jgi:UDP-GlcNAc:undecaprenyl-phosphate/decaprenyl-phosphate GlcNAc-1-phosphate transferase
LLEGPVMAGAMALGALGTPGLSSRVRLAAAVAAVGAGGVGVLDDLAERGGSKGLSGHLSALGRGELTTGAVKIAGLAVTGLAVGALVREQPRGSDSARTGTRTGPIGGGALQWAVDACLVAGAANLANLLDLRPGRCLKAGLLATPGVVTGGPAAPLLAVTAGAAAALLPIDLAERAMLGDGGANALGAVLGTAAVVGAGPRTRAAALAGVVALTLVSERVSFTRVIESTPVLRELDALGRRPR